MRRSQQSEADQGGEHIAQLRCMRLTLVEEIALGGQNRLDVGPDISTAARGPAAN